MVETLEESSLRLLWSEEYSESLSSDGGPLPIPLEYTAHSWSNACEWT